eukprot:COSAG04_NODE_5234_length_1691_cov_1.807789_3_plen_90_part_00
MVGLAMRLRKGWLGSSPQDPSLMSTSARPCVPVSCWAMPDHRQRSAAQGGRRIVWRGRGGGGGGTVAHPALVIGVGNAVVVIHAPVEHL